MRVAVEGCGHGTLDAIYSSIDKSCEVKGWDGVDLVIIGGDFQAVRDSSDLNVTAMPAKYRRMGDFSQYYYGTKTAPYLTIFVGGNHEASNHLFELYYGGWVAPNIYYLGSANVIQVGPLKIAGLSGIWKGYDYRKPHFERLPYGSDDIQSIYHVRELDARKLLSFRSQVDIGLSHDWPKGIEWLGNHKNLFSKKTFLKSDALSGKLGNTAAQQIMDRLRPPYWFSAHLHTKYAAVKLYGTLSELQNQAQLDQSSSDALNEKKRAYHQHSPKNQQQHESLLAWNKFGAQVAIDEANETAKILEGERTRREEAQRSGVPITANYILEETYKKVKLENGHERSLMSTAHNIDSRKTQQDARMIPQSDGCCESLPIGRRKSGAQYTNLRDTQADELVALQITSMPVSNPDEINIESSDDETMRPTNDVDTANSKANEQDGKTSSERQTDGVVEPSSRPGDSPSISVANDVSEDMRSQLAALSSKFEDAPTSSAPLPHPETITNDKTRFLALSKCEDRQNFLQLLEIEPYDGSTEVTNGPVKLQYVPEWLAILRTFAPELSLGDRHAKVPSHQGDSFYRERIIEEEKWIEQHVVQTGKLDVPEDFVITTPEFNTIVAGGGMPREVTNPQTSVFCQLIGIENLFDISEEEREARMAAGPDESHANVNRGRGGGGSRGNRGGRGRGRVRRGSRF